MISPEPRRSRVVVAVVLLGALLLALAGCGLAVNPDEARICRRILPALNAGSEAIEILQTLPARREALGMQSADAVVEIVYSVTNKETAAVFATSMACMALWPTRAISVASRRKPGRSRQRGFIR